MNMGVMEGYFINFANTTGSNTQGVLHTKFVVADHSGSKALEFVAFAYFIGMLVPAMFTFVPGMPCYAAFYIGSANIDWTSFTQVRAD